MQRVLFIPDQLTDYRMWAGIPDRLARRAAVSHLDQLVSLPWSAYPAAVVPLARNLAPAGWDVVVAAGRGAPFAVELAAAGLARSLVLVEPPIPADRIPENVDLPDTAPGNDALLPYEPLVSELHDALPDEWRDLLVQTIRETTPPEVPADELDLVVRIAADHAAEARAQLIAFEAAEAAGWSSADDPQWTRQRDRGQWLDQLATLTLPVLTIVPAAARFVGRTIGRVTEDAQTVVTDRSIVPPSSAVARDQAATALQLLLDRLGG
jgi:NAD(P)-dependent dehydrogenase (short-subunit alcohol dehydrogenase family)